MDLSHHAWKFNSMSLQMYSRTGLGSTPQHLVRRWTIMLNVPVKNVIKEGQGISHMVWQSTLPHIAKMNKSWGFFIWDFITFFYLTFAAHLLLTCPYTRGPSVFTLGMGIREDLGRFNGERVHKGIPVVGERAGETQKKKKKKKTKKSTHQNQCFH